MLEPWFDHLRRDPDVIKMGRTFGAQFGVRGVDGLTAVVDSSVVLSEIAWLAKRPGCAVVHVAVPGLANSGVLRPICPHLVEDEVRRRLPEFSRRFNRTVAELEAIWGDYRAYLRFVDAVPAHTAAVRYIEERDPNDVDFVHVQESFGIDVILTNDNDLKDSPAPTAEDSRALLAAFRVYEKEKRYKFALVVGGWTFALSGQISVIALAKTLKFLWDGFTRLPWWLQLGVSLAAAYGVSRLKKEHFDWIASTLRPLLVDLAREAITIAEVAQAAESRATEALAAARTKVPPRNQRRALLPTIRRVLVDHPDGVTEADLAAAVAAHGYKSKSKDLPSYLGRVLRRQPGAACQEGRWQWVGVGAAEA